MSVSYNFITDRLATGGQLAVPADVETMVQAGVTHIIDCTDDDLSNHLPGLSVLWNPTEDDGQTKGPEWFGPSLDYGLMALSKPKSKLYAHCLNGRNRGPSTAFCLMLAMGWTYNAAIDLIHGARPETRGFIVYANDAANSLRQLGYLD